MPRPANRPSRREALLAAAAEVFASEESVGVTLATIAARAGMSPSALYYHFPSRQAIVETLVAGIIDELIDVFAPRDDEHDPAKWGVAGVERLGDWFRQSPVKARALCVFEDDMRGGPEMLSQFRQHTQRLQDALVTTMAGMAPDLDVLEATIMARALIALAGETARLSVAEDNTIRPGFRTQLQAAQVIVARVLAGAASGRSRGTVRGRR
jgi:AcrR family transcriptional regulator